MLLTLPVELIQRVVRLSTPEEITSTTYQPRQDTLRALCLVNSLLRDIAQPILDEALTIGGKTVWRSRVGHTGERKSRLRFLWIQSGAAVIWTVDVGTFRPLLEFVRELRLCSLEDVGVGLLADAPCLVRLSLQNLNVVEAQPSAVLRGVKELTCDTVSTSQTDVTTFLSPTTFPQLEFLAHYRGVHRYCKISPALYAQLLCVVFLDADNMDKPALTSLPGSCQPFINVALQYIDNSISDAPLCALYRIRTNESTPSDVIYPNQFQRVANLIANSDGSTLRLSRLSLCPTILSLSAFPSISEAVEALVMAAEERGVEVVFEEDEREVGGSFLSLSTIEYAKKLRAEQEKADVVRKEKEEK